MKAKTIFKSDVSEAVHSSASALLKARAINKATIRDFESRHLIKAPNFEPDDIARIRTANNVSQPVFALYLNTSQSTIEKWERGAKKPSGMALRLLDVVRRHGIEVLC